MRRMRCKSLLLTLVALAAAPGQLTGQITPPPPFAGEIAEFAIRDQVRMPRECGLLFVGSSSIKLWVGLEQDFAGRNPVQRGFGGSQTEHVNLYFDQLVARYRPSRIVLYEGENDIDAGKSLEEIETDFLTFMRRKTEALGATPVYFIAVKPSPARWAKFARQSALNARVRALAATREDLVFVDIVSDMLDDSQGTPDPGLFIADRLHMNEHGYAIWRKRLREALRTAVVSTAPHCLDGRGRARQAQ